VIVCHSGRWAYLDPPRTGTTAIARFLVERGGEFFPPQHEPPPPWELVGWRVLLSVRHPVARAWSLYHHRRRYLPDLDPVAFAQSLVDRSAWYWDGRTCSDWARQYPRVLPIRLEFLAADLAGLGFEGDPEHLNAMATGQPPEAFARMALTWGAEDLCRWYLD
jgi:hypothetical protein